MIPGPPTNWDQWNEVKDTNWRENWKEKKEETALLYVIQNMWP